MKGKRLLAGLMAALMCFGTAPAMTGIAAEGTQDSSSVVATVDSHYSVIIPKSLVMSVDTATWHGAADYQATVIGDIEMGKSVYVVPQARFDMTKEDGSAIVNTAVSQTKTEWPSADVKSAEEDAIWGDGSLSGDGFQPGDWSGVFYFNIAADDSGKTIEAPGDKVISTDLKDGDVADAGTFQLGQGQSGSIQLMMDGQDVTRLATYESDNERITVSDQGVVNTDNANGGDEATITATYYTQTAAAADDVGTNVVKAYFKVQVIGITFDKETVTARPGDTVEVTASILPDSVDGTVKWMLNGLDFGYEGNTITINVAEDAQPGNYALVAMYGGTSQTLNIKVEPAIGEHEHIFEGGTMKRACTICGVADFVFIGSGDNKAGEAGSVVIIASTNKLYVNGEEQSKIMYTFPAEGTYTLKAVAPNGFVYEITKEITHHHVYENGACTICGQKDPDAKPASISGVQDGQSIQAGTPITVGQGNTVTVNGSPVPVTNNQFTLNEEGSYTIIVTGADGSSLTLHITVEHVHTYEDGSCTKCGKLDESVFASAGLWTASGTKLRSWTVLTEDYNLDIEANYTSSTCEGTNAPKTIFAKSDVNPNSSNYVLVCPDSVTTIGNYAFYQDAKLRGVIAKGVTKIGDYAFSGSGVRTTMPMDDITSVGAYAYSSTNITKADVLCSTGNGAYSNCTKLKNVNITISGLGTSTFENCTALTSVDLSTVSMMGSNCFKGSGLTEVTIPASMHWTSSLGTGCLSGMSNLAAVNVYGGTLKADVFTGSRIKTFNLKEGSWSITKDMFDSMSFLTAINVESDDEYASVDGVLYSKDMTRLIKVPARSTAITNGTYAIPDSVTEIRSYAFKDCTGLTSISIPGSVKSLHGHVFDGCTNLASVSVQSGVIALEDYAFSNLPRLANVELSDTVSSIGASAFENCPRLSEIAMSGGLTSIGANAFKSDAALASIALPDGLATIGNGAFYGCTGLTSITIPGSVKSVGTILGGCTNIKTVTMESGVKSIAASAFSGLSGMTSVSIPDTVSTIGNGAFSNCSKLASIEIPGAVKTINPLFSGCYALKTIILNDGTTKLAYGAFASSSATYIRLPDTLTTIDQHAFEDCTSLKHLFIPKSVTSVSIYDPSSGKNTVTMSPLWGCSTSLALYTDGTDMPGDWRAWLVASTGKHLSQTVNMSRADYKKAVGLSN